MTTNQKIASGVFGVVALFVAIFIGRYFGPVYTNTTQVNAVTSPVGTTFNSAKVAQINITPSTASATSTGVLNTDSYDRYIEAMYGACSGVGTSLTAYTGAGLASLGLTVTAATGTTAAPNTITNTNSFVMTVATTTVDSFASTTSATNLSRVWATGSYLNFAFNATNTAACTVGVHYIGS